MKNIKEKDLCIGRIYRYTSTSNHLLKLDRRDSENMYFKSMGGSPSFEVTNGFVKLCRYDEDDNYFLYYEEQFKFGRGFHKVEELDVTNL